MHYSLIANSGIQLLTFPIEISTAGRYKKIFLEGYDEETSSHTLEILQERVLEGCYPQYYRKRPLQQQGLIDPISMEVDWEGADELGIYPIPDEELSAEKATLSFGSNKHDIAPYENVWIPLPYFNTRGKSRIDFNAFNWIRCKLIPEPAEEGLLRYTVLLAIDTRTVSDRNVSKECPAFEADHITELKFSLCRRESAIMDYCSVGHPDCFYIEEYIRSLAHPGVSDIRKIKGKHKLNYLASYVLLVHHLAESELMPDITLYSDRYVECHDVDMIVDIGNSCTTAILSELSGSTPFARLSTLELTDFTEPLVERNGQKVLRRYSEPFDMRVAFRRADFGSFGYKEGGQFVHPSLVRLGREASELSILASRSSASSEALSTYSSPKRYLWDAKLSKEEWKYISLEGEKDQSILSLPGITDHLFNDGRVSRNGIPGYMHRYSRRSLMTFALLEILCQARMQINSPEYRIKYGNETHPRRLRRLLLTCPTTMSQIEREALVRCAQDAVYLLQLNTPNASQGIEVLPSYKPTEDDCPSWYYDEATCAQLVYLYSELGYKYRDSRKEFLQLYGHFNPETNSQELTIGSIDIGAGTSDFMICTYSVGKMGLEEIYPDPLFYDSFYLAGDDMLYHLIREILLTSENSSLSRHFVEREGYSYNQMLKDCCGPDYNDQSAEDLKLRRDLNLQVFIPVMYYFLDLFCRGGSTASIRYIDIFDRRAPNEAVCAYFERYVGVSLEKVEWQFDREQIYNAVSDFFESLVNKISAIMYSYSCDIILLSGRPTSLAPLRDLFLRFYPVAPNRLIRLNDHHVGDWYPFGNNTGYIKNPKTIIAVGAMIGFYSSDLSRLDGFALNTTLLGKQVISGMNYIEQPKQDNLSIKYCFTPSQHHGTTMVHNLPCSLKVRKIDFATYPSRPLFRIDYNDVNLERRVRLKLEADGSIVTSGQVWEAVRAEKERLRRLMPLELELSRESDNLEQIEIGAVVDRNGNDLSPQDFELTVQSLGVDESYWLDTGVFYN